MCLDDARAFAWHHCMARSTSFFANEKHQQSKEDGFEEAASQLKKNNEVAILACGGDGTVTWILSEPRRAPRSLGRGPTRSELAGSTWITWKGFLLGSCLCALCVCVSFSLMQYTGG